MLGFLFKRKPKEKAPAAILFNGPSNYSISGSTEENADEYRAAVDAIARNVGKLRGSHQVNGTAANDTIDRLLQIEPNPFMTAYDCLYKLSSHLYLHNNAFAVLTYDSKGILSGIYPILPNNVSFTESDGQLFYKMIVNGREPLILAQYEVLHLRRHFNRDDLLGDSNKAIKPTLTAANCQMEGIKKAVENSAVIRGVIKANTALSPEKRAAARDAFIADYANVSSGSGMIFTDTSFEYTPITASPTSIDEKQIAEVKRRIFDYLGISETIVSSTYTEDQWAAFYESVIEPFSTQLSLELTRKIFTQREIAFGNRIVFDAGRLQFSSNTTKIKLIETIMPYGLLSINQALEMLNLPPVADGDKRLQTLNVVDAAQANKYQLGDGKE